MLERKHADEKLFLRLRPRGQPAGDAVAVASRRYGQQEADDRADHRADGGGARENATWRNRAAARMDDTWTRLLRHAMAESEGDTEAEFRQYLVQSQAATELLKVLVGLEEADPKPENPVQFLTDFFGSQARRRCILWLSRALAASRPDE